MKRARFAALGATLLLTTATACSRNTSVAPAAIRNVLLISLDTTRADALSPYGAPQERTPTIARLARDGAVFETAISPLPLTLPAHATMMTGLDPCRHSVRDNSAYALPPAALTLAETLQGAGWRTFAAVGSVVLLPRHGLDQGFARYDAEGLRVSQGPEHERQADAVADATLRLLSGTEPFFGFVHFYDPHRPYRAPPELEQRFGDPYFAEIHLADRAIGRVLEGLSAQGFLERTIIVVTADHGEGRGDHGETSHGMLLHDATQHVPLIVRMPGLAPRRIGGLVATLADLMPTLLELVGVEAPPALDGRSLVAAMRGEAMEPGDAYLETLFPLRAYDFAPLFGVRTLDWKFVQGARAHLWHLADDATEQHDVAADHADVVAALTRRALHLRDGRGAALAADGRIVSGEELRVLGGLGYVAGTAAGFGDDDAAERPDPCDDVGAIEASSRAEELIAAGRTREAIAAFEPLARRFPGTAHLRATLGALYGQAGAHEQALTELLAAAKLRPRSPDVQIQAALAAWMSRRPDLSRSLLETATTLPGCEPRGFLLLAEALTTAREPDAARALLRKLLERGDLSAQDRAAADESLRSLGG